MIFEKPGKETFQIFHFLVVFRVTNYSQKNSKIYQKTPLRRREANKKSMMMMIRGGFGGGGGGVRGADASSLRDLTPYRPKGSPLGYFLGNPCLVTDPSSFLKAPLAPTCNNFEGERARQKKRNFFCKFFQKVPKYGFSYLFFQKCACGAETLAKIASYFCFRRAPKVDSVDLKKVHQNFRKSAPSRKT